MNVMMKCGCTAQGTNADTGQPCCVVHYGHPDSEIVVEPPNLEGRMAQCCYCKCKQSSSVDLPFFVYQPDKEFDSLYDGCRGWD